MPGRRFGSLSVISLAGLAAVGVTALGVTPSAVDPALAARIKVVDTAAKLLSTEAIVIGGSGDPIPSQDYVDDVIGRYVNPSFTGFNDGNPLFEGQPVFDINSASALFTPEGLYPFEGVKELELNPSVSQGLSILNTSIQNQLAAGDDVHVLGYSQSAIIASQEMEKLLALPEADQPTGDQLSFSLIGDIDNPDGGIFPRFDFFDGKDLVNIPSLGITFDTATPSDTPWDTAIYTLEYDGFADFPKYPLNLLADINAVFGIAFVHGDYPTLTAAQLGDAVELTTSADYAGNTDYFMIPTENLPILDLVRIIPLIGNPISDLVQPALKVLIDLGYGNVDTDIATDPISGGWDTGPANVSTPFELFPSNIDPLDVLSALGSAIQLGVQNFIGDFTGSGPDPVSLSATNVLDALTQGAAQSSSLSLTGIVNSFSDAASQLYSAVLPTVDIANALLTSMPAYDVELFTNFIGEGDIANALLMPIGADFALTTAAGLGFELRVIENAVVGAIQAFDPSFTLSL